MDELLDIGFFVAHTLWMAFTCLGWIWRRTRPWQLLTAMVTALSWFGLGIKYGWGYCPCTDWHWQIRARLGHDDPPSYIQLLIDTFTGLEITLGWANVIAVLGLVIPTALGALLTIRDRRAAAHR